MDPPGQPLHRRLSRYFWGFPPFLALVETIALAVHFQDMDMVGEAVQQSPGQAFRAEYLRPRRCHVNHRVTSLWAPTPEIMQRSSLAATVSSRRRGIGGVFGGRPDGVGR